MNRDFTSAAKPREFTVKNLIERGNLTTHKLKQSAHKMLFSQTKPLKKMFDDRVRPKAPLKL